MQMRFQGKSKNIRVQNSVNKNKKNWETTKLKTDWPQSSTTHIIKKYNKKSKVPKTNRINKNNQKFEITDIFGNKSNKNHKQIMIKKTNRRTNKRLNDAISK